MKKLTLLISIILTSINLTACSSNNDNKNTDEDNNKSYSVSNKIDDIDIPENQSLIKYLDYKQEKIKLEFISGSQDEINENETPPYMINKLKINDKMADLRYYSISSVQVIDGVVILSTHGTDTRSTTLYAFDMNGKKLLEIHDLDDNGMTIKIDADDFKIENDKILLHGSRLYHGPSLIYRDGKEVELTDSNGNYLSTVPEDEVIDADFEIKYLGDGEFGPVTKTQTTLTYGQLNKNLPVYNFKGI